MLCTYDEIMAWYQQRKEAGLTIEEYKAKVSRDRKIKRLTKDLECAKAEVARLEAELAKI